MPNQNDLLEAALKYVENGWLVFPCHATEHTPLDSGKDSKGRGGFYLATTDVNQICNWWELWPDAAIALRTGKESGVFAVDVDPRHCGDTSMEDLEAEHGPLPDTVESETGGGGRHIFFKWPGQEVKCSTGAIAPGIDIKGDGGYVILPPSDHKTGKTYIWIIDHEPGSFPVAEAPAWLLEQIARKNNPGDPKITHPQTSPDDPISEGYRNKSLTRMAGYLRYIGMNAKAINAALQETNIDRCQPPLAEPEVESIARSIARYDPDCRARAEMEHWVEQYLVNNPNETAFGPVMTCLADVEPRDVDWLWPKRIAIGKITMLAGDPGLGKRFCSLDIAARVSAGLPWPDLPDSLQQPGGVIILSAEDALDDTIRPRLDAAGADPSRIYAIEAVREFDPNTGKPRQRGFNLAEDMENLGQALQQMKDCRLIVIDPISAYIGDSNSHNNAEVRALLTPLTGLAEKYRVAVLAISHLNKGAGEAMYRIMGSLAFIAAARAGYAVFKDRDDETGQRRLVLPIKNNLGDDETGLAYSITETVGNAQPHIEWEPNVVNIPVEDAINIDKPRDKNPPSPEQKAQNATQLEEAVDWLKSYLADGEKPAQEVLEAARKDGLAKRTVERAKLPAGVFSRREDAQKGGRWLWYSMDIDGFIERTKAANAA